jgi:hypothetical protein
MSITPLNSPPVPSREDAAQGIVQVTRRLPLIVRILEELHGTAIPCPGDDDIRHGCDRALTTMLSELAKMQSAPDGKPSLNEQKVRTLLGKHAAHGLVDADKLQRMQIFIDRIFLPEGHH